MRAGRLRHRVTLQSQTTDRDTAGQKEDKWQNIATVWAAVEDVSGREIIRGGVASGQLTTRITIRYRSGLSNDMRIIHGNRTYELVSPPVDSSGRRRILELLCREIKP